MRKETANPESVIKSFPVEEDNDLTNREMA